MELFGAGAQARVGVLQPELTHPNKDHPQWSDAVAAQNQKYADIAASIQRVTEETLLKMARHAHATTGSKNLVMAGGVALNSVANGRIVRETPFESVYIQPAAGDAGGALGAALYVYHVLLGKPRNFVLEHAYWGAEYSEDRDAGRHRRQRLRLRHHRGRRSPHRPRRRPAGGRQGRRLVSGPLRVGAARLGQPLHPGRPAPPR